MRSELPTLVEAGVTLYTSEMPSDKVLQKDLMIIEKLTVINFSNFIRPKKKKKETNKEIKCKKININS